ncbi:hypothetical protein ACHAWT_002422 [Skeletonema menzelii]
MADRHNRHAASPSVTASTPNWMTSQRRQRQRNRGYGRRTSIGGGSSLRSTPMNNNNRRDSTVALFGSAAAAPTTRYEPSASLDFDADEDLNLDHLLDRPMNARIPRLNRSNSLSDDFQIEAREEVEDRGNSFPAVRAKGNRRKKNGPSLPRPPKPAARATSAGLQYRYQPKQDTKNCATNNAETSSSSSGFESSSNNSDVMAEEEAQLHSSPVQIGARGDIKRSKIMLRRSESVPMRSSSSLTVTLSSHGVRSSTLPSIRSASSLEENVLPNNTNINNNNNAVASTPAATRRSSRRLESKQKERESNHTFTRSRANSKKRSASPSSRLGPTSELDPSPPKIPSMSNFSTFSSSSTSNLRTSSSSSSSSESFSSLAKQQHKGRGWGNHSHHPQRHTRAASASVSSTFSSPVDVHHKKSLSVGGMLTSELRTPLLSPPMEGPSTPSVESVSSRKRSIDSSSPPIICDLDRSESTKLGTSCPPFPFTHAHTFDEFDRHPFKASEPADMFASPPMFGKSRKSDVCFLGSDEKETGRSHDSMVNDSLDDDDDDDEDDKSTSSFMSEESDCEDAEEEEVQKEMTDSEIFESKSSYEDFKFLVKFLRDWAKKVNAKSASMGLNDGCLVAIPPAWLFERRANFSKWAVTALGFRVGSVGGGGGSFLKCSEARGKEVFQKLRRILNDHKGGRLQMPVATDNTAIASTHSGRKELAKSAGPLFGSPFSENSMSTSTKRSTFRLPMQPRMSLSPPMTDAFVGDCLADAMKDMSVDSKPRHSGGHHMPHIIRSTLQPLRRIKNALPHRPRLSSGDDVGSTRDFMESLHGVMGSPSPFGVARSLRDKCSRALHPPEQLRNSFGRPPRQSFDSKTCQSPHPRNILAQQTPSQLYMETPITKPVENWGSKPIAGRDWGESSQCCDLTIDACNQIFAAAWCTSDFHDNECLCSEYGLAMSSEDEASLWEHYTACDDSRMNCGVDELQTRKRIGFQRHGSVGASAFAHLHIDDDDVKATSAQHQNEDMKRAKKLRKMRRMSLFAAASGFLQPSRRFRLSVSPSKKVLPLACVEEDDDVPFEHIMECQAFSAILSFLSEGELLHTASLVSSAWADASAEALGNLMLISVGCSPSLISDSHDDESSDVEDDDMKVAAKSTAPKAKSMQKKWTDVINTFPWANFLSDGAFKRVYKVWNDALRSYEAISVMDVDAIEASGNLNCVGAELAVSQLLSSVARRNICPNFVITRGVFTCTHEPPPSQWGYKENAAPRGTSYDGRGSHLSLIPEPGRSANYQYIRMELCQHGDMEDFIRKLPDATLSPNVCRNLLFQMAFSLHVASDRFGLKHYDVKLLNFFLQSALDPSIAVDSHPNVVLRYGVGSHVFRLRMDPSNAHIAKLADYGTSVLRSNADGQPVSLGQFTTLENTPPDYLILGNASEQGIGHDCFGLGLCMLHLFTGHGPYEEILDEVVCPDNFKAKLRKIWRSASHDVIRSVMLYDNEDGQEVEDDTLYNTLYRFLVLFGVPQKRFLSRKHGKVWRAIDATLLPPKANGCPDMAVFVRDQERFSLSEGTDGRIANARRRLEGMDGAMELLLSLVSFDPKKRATPLDVINSRFMSVLIEDDAVIDCESDIVKSYTAYQT